MKAQEVSPAVREIVHTRSGWVCEICGQRRVEEIHHRLGRQMGGSREPWINLAGNLLDLCLICHRMVTVVPKAGKTDAYRARGWLVKRGVVPPSAHPVYLWHGYRLSWWLLDDEGGLARPTPGERIELSMAASFGVPLDDESDRFHDRMVDQEMEDR